MERYEGTGNALLFSVGNGIMQIEQMEPNGPVRISFKTPDTTDPDVWTFQNDSVVSSNFFAGLMQPLLGKAPGINDKG